MANRDIAIILLPAIIVVGVVAAGWNEVHRTRVASETTAESMTELVAAVKRPAEQRARCSKEVSHLDHDVDMGPVVPCPNPADGQCVGGVAVSVAEAHCKAGKP